MKKRTLLVGIFLALTVPSFAAKCSSVVSSDLKPGAESSEVLALQKFLVKKGLLTATPNGYFGDATKKAVMVYQDSVSLPDTGNVFDATRLAVNQESCTGITPVTSFVDTQDTGSKSTKVINTSLASCVDLPRNIVRGEENSLVLKLQNFLVKKGLLTAIPNSYYGVGTTAAVKAYQASHGFKQSGDTLAMMRDEIKNETCTAEVVDASLPEGCASASGFSTVTGKACSTKITYPDGCTSLNGFSITTGVSCAVQGVQTTQVVQNVQPTSITVATSTPVSTATTNATATTPQVVFSELKLLLTPNSPGVPFTQNSTHMKLANFVIQSPDTMTIGSLTLLIATTSMPQNTLTNFTLTDVNADKIINGGPFFTFTNQTVLANQAKVYELYADIGSLGSLASGTIDFNGALSLKGDGSTITNIVVPTFKVTVSK